MMVWPDWPSDDTEPPEYEPADDGPEANMWRSIQSAAISMGFQQQSCPVCNGRGWLWITEEGNPQHE